MWSAPGGENSLPIATPCCRCSAAGSAEGFCTWSIVVIGRRASLKELCFQIGMSCSQHCSWHSNLLTLLTGTVPVAGTVNKFSVASMLLAIGDQKRLEAWAHPSVPAHDKDQLCRTWPPSFSLLHLYRIEVESQKLNHPGFLLYLWWDPHYACPLEFKKKKLTEGLLCPYHTTMWSLEE